MNFFFGFSGRIGRMAWWLGELVPLVILVLALTLIGGFHAASRGSSAGFTVMVLLGSYVAMVWINVALTVKRYHDRDKPWPWVLVMLIPFIGGMWQLVECGFLAGTPGTNAYGDPPGSMVGSTARLHERFAARGIDGDRNDAVIERWTTMVSVEEKVVSKSERTAPQAHRTASRPTGPVSFGRRGV